MNFSCSQCSFTAQFESALLMHKQLHHDSSDGYQEPVKLAKDEQNDLFSLNSSPNFSKRNKTNVPTKTTSATRLFGKLKAKICKSKTLFVHPEESQECLNIRSLKGQAMSSASECTSKAMKSVRDPSRCSTVTSSRPDAAEIYACHLCSFDADRITVLDRHLLNDHKIGLESLLQLVMAKTKDGLNDDAIPNSLGIRQPYYKQQNEIIHEGEFIIETVTPKIKILKHTATNTELNMIKQKDPDDAEGLEDNWKTLSSEIENMVQCTKNIGDDDVLSKMKTLNDCMCKIVDSSNLLKKVLETKVVRDLTPDTSFNLGLGDRETPRNWGRAYSERMERGRNKYFDSCRPEKGKLSSESFYF